jgi:hypothetical protein
MRHTIGDSEVILRPPETTREVLEYLCHTLQVCDGAELYYRCVLWASRYVCEPEAQALIAALPAEEIAELCNHLVRLAGMRDLLPEYSRYLQRVSKTEGFSNKRSCDCERCTGNKPPVDIDCRYYDISDQALSFASIVAFVEPQDLDNPWWFTQAQIAQRVTGELKAQKASAKQKPTKHDPNFSIAVGDSVR